MIGTAPAKKKGLPVGVALGAGLAAGAALFALALLVRGPWRDGLAAGVVASTAGGLIGLLFVARSLGRPLQAAIVAMVGSFAVRALLVGVGLLMTLRILHAAPLGFVVAFFPIFFGYIALEAAVLRAGSLDGVPES